MTTASRANTVGRLTTTRFWLLTRMPKRRPYSSLMIDCTVSVSASRSVRVAIPFVRTLSRTRANPSIQCRPGVAVTSMS